MSYRIHKFFLFEISTQSHHLSHGENYSRWEPRLNIFHELLHDMPVPRVCMKDGDCLWMVEQGVCGTCRFSLWCGPYVCRCASPATHLTRLNMCRGFIGWKTTRASQKLWPQTTWCAAREAKEFISNLLASSSITAFHNLPLFTSYHAFQTVFNPNSTVIRKPCLIFIIHEPHV